MSNRNKLIMGSALGIAALTIAIDHTKHRLPDPVVDDSVIVIEEEADSPCSMSGNSPCSMTEQEGYIIEGEDKSPCSMSEPADSGSPCSM